VTQQFRFYVGVDWAAEQHQACVLNTQGEVLEQRKVEHSGSGITGFMTWMEALADGQVELIAVSIEVPRGPLVDAFLEHRWAVFSINPKQLDRFRDRHTVAGATRQPSPPVAQCGAVVRVPSSSDTPSASWSTYGFRIIWVPSKRQEYISGRAILQANPKLNKGVNWRTAEHVVKNWESIAG
jgi:hypothetical protein